MSYVTSSYIFFKDISCYKCYYIKLRKRVKIKKKGKNESLTYRNKTLNYLLIQFTHIVCMIDAFTPYESFLNKITVSYGVICVSNLHRLNYPCVLHHLLFKLLCVLFKLFLILFYYHTSLTYRKNKVCFSILNIKQPYPKF